MVFRFLIIVTFAVTSLEVLAGATYRWEDENGGVHYSDQLPPAEARNVTRTNIGGNIADQDLPYRLRIAVEKSPVTLYVTKCGTPCDKARELLVKRGVPHTLLDVSQRDGQAALLKLVGEDELVVPVASIGRTILKGFEAGQWNAALDAAGYPSFAMIDVKPNVPQPGQPANAQGDGEEVADQDAETTAEFETESTDSDTPQETTLDEGTDEQVEQ